MHEPCAAAERREALTRDAERVGVAIEADDRELREPFEEGPRVPAHAERRVDEDRAVALESGREQFDRAVEHDWGVDAFVVHDPFRFPGLGARSPIRSS